MTISYKKLWVKLAEHEMKKTDLLSFADISTSTLAKLGKNQSVKVEILIKICNAFHCDVGGIMEFLEDKQ